MWGKGFEMTSVARGDYGWEQEVEEEGTGGGEGR